MQHHLGKLLHIARVVETHGRAWVGGLVDNETAELCVDLRLVAVLTGR